MKAALDGWEISGITLYQSGTPFSVYNGASANGISVIDNAGIANGLGIGPQSEIASYPDVVGSPHNVPPPGSNNSKSYGPTLLNPAAFVAPTGLTSSKATTARMIRCGVFRKKSCGFQS